MPRRGCSRVFLRGKRTCSERSLARELERGVEQKRFSRQAAAGPATGVNGMALRSLG